MWTCESPLVTVIYDLHEAAIQVRPFLLHVYPSFVSWQMLQLGISTSHIQDIVHSFSIADAETAPHVINLQSVN